MSPADRGKVEASMRTCMRGTLAQDLREKNIGAGFDHR